MKTDSQRRVVRKFIKHYDITSLDQFKQVSEDLKLTHELDTQPTRTVGMTTLRLGLFTDRAYKLQEIGDEFNVSKQFVYDKIQRYVKRIKEHLKSR